MKKNLIIFGVLIFTILIIILFYTLFKYVFLHNWWFLMFYSYILGGFVYFGISFRKAVKLNRNLRSSLNRFTLFALCSQVIQKVNLFHKVRERVASYLMFIYETLLWPSIVLLIIYNTCIGVNYLEELSKKHSYEYIDKHHRSPNLFMQFKLRTEVGSTAVVFDPLVLLTNITIVYWVTYLYSPPWEYAAVFLTFMLIHLVTRHLYYITNTVGIVDYLRHRKGTPYFKYLSIVSLDFLSIVFSFAIISGVKSGNLVTFRLLEDIASRLLFFKKIGNLVLLKNMSFFDIYLGIVGIIFYLTLLRIIFRFGGFKRRENDYRILAAKHMLMGDFEKSLEYLTKIEKKNRLEIEDLRKKVICFLCLNKTESAFNAARNYLNVSGNRVNVGDDDVFSFVVESVSLVEISEEYFIEALKKGIELKVTDTRVYSAIEIGIVKFGVFGNEGSYVNRIKLLFQEKTIRNSFPISFANILIIQNELLEAIIQLKYYNQKNDIDKIACRSLSLLANLELGEIIQARGLPMKGYNFFSLWIMENHIKNILLLVDKLSNNWEVVFAITVLYSWLDVVSLYFQKHKTNWLQAINKLKISIEDDDEIKYKVEIIEKMFKKQFHRFPIEG